MSQKTQPSRAIACAITDKGPQRRGLTPSSSAAAVFILTPPSTGFTCRARTVLGWPKQCKLVRAFLREHSYNGLKLVQFLGQGSGRFTQNRKQPSGQAVFDDWLFSDLRYCGRCEPQWRPELGRKWHSRRAAPPSRRRHIHRSPFSPGGTARRRRAAALYLLADQLPYTYCTHTICLYNHMSNIYYFWPRLSDAESPQARTAAGTLLVQLQETMERHALAGIAWSIDGPARWVRSLCSHNTR